MDENLELLEYIYQNSEMGVFSCEKLIQDINGKENKIKEVLEKILKGYEQYKKESKNLYKKYRGDLKKNSIFTKMSASMGMKMRVSKDNSDASIAHLLTEGLTMGIVDISSKIDRYENNVDKKLLKLSKEYLKFQNEMIELLKEYL